jgi:hypothetical protein
MEVQAELRARRAVTEPSASYAIRDPYNTYIRPI